MNRREFLKSAAAVAAIAAGIRPSTTKRTIDSKLKGHNVTSKTYKSDGITNRILRIDVDIDYAVPPTVGHPTNVWLIPDGAESQNEWRYVGSLISEGKSGLQRGAFSVPYYSDLDCELCVTDIQQPAQVTTHIKPIEFEIH